MNIQFDNSSTSGLKSSLSTYDFELITTIGQDKYPGLVVGISIFGAGSVSSVLVEGTNLSFIREETSGNFRSEIWHLLSVPHAAGSLTITVNLSGALDSIAGAACYSYYGGIGVNSQFGAMGVDDASENLTTEYSDSIAFANVATQTTSGVTGGSIVHALNNRWDVPSASGTGMAGDKGPYPTAGVEVQMGFDNIGVTDVYVMSVVELLSYIPSPPALMGM